MRPVEFDDDFKPTTITIRGREWPVTKIHLPWVRHDKKAYMDITYKYRKNQLAYSYGRFTARVCKHCGKIVPHGSKMYCSDLCRGRYHSAKQINMASYIDDVPEYLRKYMVVVDDGETR